MEPDVEAKIAADYPVALRGGVRELLQLLEQELGSDGFPRIARCVLFLARGDMDRLLHNINGAVQDSRDVIYWAEYDEQDSQVRDFNKPITGS